MTDDTNAIEVVRPKPPALVVPEDRIDVVASADLATLEAVVGTQRVLLLATAGFNLPDVEKAIRRTRQALDAKKVKGDRQVPDWAVRQKAAETVFAMTGLTGRVEADIPDRPQVLNLTVVTGEQTTAVQVKTS